MQFFWTGWNSIQNYCAFALHVCWWCKRFWTPELRDAARPWCIWKQHYGDWLEQQYPDIPDEWFLAPTWIPTECGMRLDKDP